MINGIRTFSLDISIIISNLQLEIYYLIQKYESKIKKIFILFLSGIS